jgi:hypothetical protein
MAERAVSSEPVSANSFPVIREKYRELRPISGISADFRGKFDLISRPFRGNSLITGSGKISE